MEYFDTKGACLNGPTPLAIVPTILQDNQSQHRQILAYSVGAGPSTL